jgi:hypothetical protein
VFGPSGALITAFVPPANTPAGFREGTSFALDRAGRLFIYDERAERVQVYQ